VDVTDRLKICQLVAGVLHADDDYAPAEKHFLARVYARFGLPPEQWDQVQPIPMGAASAALRELPADAHTKIAALLVEAAIADGVVDARERVYLLVAAAAMGIDPIAMEQRIVKRLEALAERGPMSNP
jgi:uncharacterized tellurite resistance protein B-like protein